MIFMFSFIIMILTCASKWMLFKKYELSGWLGLIPILGDYLEYEQCWIGYYGIIQILAYSIGNELLEKGGVSTLVGLVLYVVSLALSFIFADKKSRAFGCSRVMTVILFFFPFIGNLLIGMNNDCYFDPSRI